MSIVKRIALAVCLMSTLAVLPAPHHPMNPSHADPTHGRLGGYDGMPAGVDDFIGRLVADKKLTKFFVGHSEDSLKKIRMPVIDQLCAAAGGPCLYTGRDMKTSHHGLGITSDDWDAAANHLVETLDKFKVPAAEKGELLAFVCTLKKDIVGK